MFPNDDICNEIAAKRAARNIFKSFSSANDNQHNVGLGEEEVSRLMKKVYSIVDVDYEPSKTEIAQFINVFQSGGEGKITLESLEQKAVKFLCGEEVVNINTQVDKLLSNQSDRATQVCTANKFYYPILEETNPSTHTLAQKGKNAESLILQKHKSCDNIILRKSLNPETKNRIDTIQREPQN